MVASLNRTPVNILEVRSILDDIAQRIARFDLQESTNSTLKG